ncbi:hypothetical protein K470DRAFT_255613 [Piedraia hortae CBS 480.64]|uniref:Nuclear pore complex protein n=1 Tax=Piedraia hortae CBS 480.64 TaxID=1314780 RepID=A0A6A7C7Q3_9PEZI|nr:hypothetical protein K470DRAFT_255613 [Piedraia hortae CBS 480.64]
MVSLMQRSSFNANSIFNPRRSTSLAANNVDSSDIVLPSIETEKEDSNLWFGHDADEFARLTDAFLARVSKTDVDNYDAAQILVQDYGRLTRKTMAERRKAYEKERAEQLRREWAERTALSTNKPLAVMAEQVYSLRQYEQECDIWSLFGLMLELRMKNLAPQRYAREQTARTSFLTEINRYTPEKELWDRFLVEDDEAREQEAVKKWLEKTADHQDSNIAAIVAELEKRSGSGKGLWSQGWMHTREKIKGEKRLRSWPSGSQSIRPQIRDSAGTEMLVTQLDPDAPSRQNGVLEQPDKYYEKAVWVAIWEMLRRGKSLQDIGEWCEQRREGWRAAVLSGQGPEWRRMCYQASVNCSADYEAAVYGLLGGNIEVAQRVCYTVEDHLFAHYTVVLVRKFHDYVQKCPGRQSEPLPGQMPSDVSRTIQQLRETKTEWSAPLKIVESYILAKNFFDLFVAVGHAVSDLDAMRGDQARTVARLRLPPLSLEPEAKVVGDAHTLRVVVHMLMIIRAVETDWLMGPAEENILAAYVQTLRAADRWDAAPLYAAYISPPRQEIVLGHVLEDIHSTQDQRNFLKLLVKYREPAILVIQQRLEMALQDTKTQTQTPLAILQGTPTGPRIRKNFLPTALDETDTAILETLHWFQLLPAVDWPLAFPSLTTALRKCLLSGRFAICNAIVRDFPFATYSPNPRHKSGDSYHSITLILAAAEALSDWIATDPSSEHTPTSPNGHPHKATHSLTTKMSPLLHIREAGLPFPSSDAVAEGGDILPPLITDLILAYILALSDAGRNGIRGAYEECMDIAVQVAGNEYLTQCFGKLGKMNQLVELFADTAQDMLGKGDGWDYKGRGVGVWG